MAPERARTVEFPDLVDILFIGAHTVLLSEITDDREKHPELMDFVHNSKPRLGQLRKVESVMKELITLTHPVPTNVSSQKFLESLVTLQISEPRRYSVLSDNFRYQQVELSRDVRKSSPRDSLSLLRTKIFSKNLASS